MEADPDYRDIYPYLVRFQCHFDQTMVVRGAGRHSRIPPMLRLVADHSFYAVYDIVPDARCR